MTNIDFHILVELFLFELIFEDLVFDF